MTYYFVKDLNTEIQIPENGMISRTLHNDEVTKITLFGFAPDHEMKTHSAPVPATIEILTGEAEVTLGSDKQDVATGSLIHMQPQLTHGIVAKTPLLVLLTLHKSARSSI